MAITNNYQSSFQTLSSFTDVLAACRRLQDSRRYLIRTKFDSKYDWSYIFQPLRESYFSNASHGDL